MSTPGPAQSTTVLLVTADPAERAGLARTLAEGGLGVLEAEAAVEAMRRATCEGPHLVLLGAPLPDLPPAEVCRRLRADPITADIPVLLLCGECDRNGDADGPTSTPPRQPDLVARVRSLVRLHRAEELARAARREADQAGARLAAVLQSSEDAIVSLDPAGNVTAWNGAAERLYGSPAHELLGRPCAFLVAPERRADLEAARERLARGEAVPPLDSARTGPDGRRLHVSVRLAPVRDRGGSLVGALAIARDVTERRRLEEQFLQAQKMDAVGRLAGGVAHDFNNLLTVINGYADMLLEDLGEEAACADHARAIRKAGERAAALTQQLLAFGRKQIIASRLLDLNAVVAAAGSLIGRLIGEDILLSVDLQPGLGHVRADPTQLQQVLLNLAVNARDAMPEGGRLSISTREAEPGSVGAAGPHVELAVADTGHGMTEEVRRHLFEPFFTTKAVGKGPGLGLAVVYGIVKQSGGHIDVETGPGVGTTFRICLPRVADPEPPRPPVEAGPPRRETVLLAEDEDAVRALARQVLGSGGYAVLEACDGAEALRLAERHPGRIDLLVSDVVMPGLGGLQLADRLRARDPTVKVLYLSGYVQDEVLRHGVSRAEVHFLAKPFSPGALAEKVREVLGTSSAGV